MEKKSFVSQISVGKGWGSGHGAESCVEIDSDETVGNTLQVMYEHKIGAILVSEKGKCVGIFTERDCLNKMATGFFDSPPSSSLSVGDLKMDMRIVDVMVTPVLVVSPNAEVISILRLMSDKRYRSTTFGIEFNSEYVICRLSTMRRR